jgi:hypothetical protein
MHFFSHRTLSAHKTEIIAAALTALVMLTVSSSGEAIAAPTVIRVVAPSGLTSGPPAGGTNVTITGTSLTGATAVTFGGAAATNVVVVDDTTITATTPAHAAGAVDVVVITPSGTGTGTNAYTYIPPRPIVTNVSPNSGTTAGATSVTITGTNFTDANIVTFGGAAATDVVVVNDNTITATTPAHSPGAVDVVVSVPYAFTGTGTSAFTYISPPGAPTVTGITPGSGATSGGTNVTITGTNFTGATAVTFGGAAATSVVVINSTTITATTPAHAAARVDVVVTAPSGIGIGTGLFTYNSTADITVTGVLPNTGPTTGGTTVYIAIAGASVSDVSAVSFGGVAATNVSWFTFSGSSKVIATTPAHAPGTVHVTVTTPSGTSVTGSNDQFTFIGGGSTSIALSSSQNPSSASQSVTFTATVTGSSPTGTVTFKDGTTVICSTVTLSSGGSASCTTSALAVGSHSITAVYSGDSNNAASTSSVLTQTVNAGAPLDSQKLRQMQIAVTRQSAQISGQSITSAIDNAIEDGFSDNVQALRPNGSGFTLNFAADEPSDARAAPWSDGVKNFVAAPDRKANQLIDEEFSALGYAKVINKAPVKPAALQRDWLAWLDVRGVSVFNNTAGADLKGNQVNATLGLTRRLTPDFLVGVLGGYEHLDFKSDALNSRLKGDGWTIGSYVGWRLTQTVRFDMALARSSISYNGSAGAASATFPGSRWLVSGGLTGTYHWQALVLQPSARIYALWEHDSAYTDSLGTAQGENNFATGRASFGGKLSNPFNYTPTIALAPYFGAYGDYYFSSSTAAVAGVATPAMLLQGWSARFTSGLGMMFKNGGQISAGAELGGIGSNSNTTVWTYRVSGSVPF